MRSWINYVQFQLGLRPTDIQRQMWRNGLFNLSRVDVTTMYQLRNRADVLSG